MADIKRIVTSDVPGRNLSDTYERSYVVGEDGRIDYYTGGGEMLAVVKPGTIYGADHDSADGQGLNTLKLIPHAPGGFPNDDRYLIIDPTMPNHIHIRAGGTIDQSNAELILGGEANHVKVDDGSRVVTISSKQPQSVQAVLNINFESNEYMVFSDMVPVSNNGWYTEVNGTKYYVADVTYPTEGQTQIYVPGATFQPQGVYNMFSPEVSSQWQFDGEGIVYGPGDGAATTFTKIETINNDGTGQNVKIGDDAWIGDLNVANHIAITGLQNPTQAGIVLGNPITGTISVAEDDLAITSNGTMTIEAVSGDMNFYMDGGMYIGDSNSDNQIIKRSDLTTVDAKTLPSGGTTGQVLSKVDGTDYNATWTDIATIASTSVVKHAVKLGEAVAKGQAVYVSSADGTNMIVSKASNATEATSSKTIGLVETAGVLNDVVNVITEGLLAGLDTSAATAGDPVWLGTNGNLIFGLANKPVAPAHLVFIGIVTRVQQNNGEIFVKPQNGFELREIHDVLLEANASIADNELLAFDAATGLWTNHTAQQANLAPLRDGLTAATAAVFPEDLERSGNTASGNYWMRGKGGVPYLVYCHYEYGKFWIRVSNIVRGVPISENHYTTTVGSDFSLGNTGYFNLRANLFGNSTGEDLQIMGRVVGGTFAGAVATTPGLRPWGTVGGLDLSHSWNPNINTETSAPNAGVAMWTRNNSTVANPVDNVRSYTGNNWKISCAIPNTLINWNVLGWLVHNNSGGPNDNTPALLYGRWGNDGAVALDGNNTWTRFEVYVRNM